MTKMRALGTWSCLLLLLSSPGCGEDENPLVATSPELVPSRVEIVGGQDLVGVVGKQALDPLAVRVLTDVGFPVEGVNVIFAIREGEATLSAEVVATDPNGVAFAFVEMGPVVGELSATATAPGLSGSPATFRMFSIAADASQVRKQSGDNQPGPAGHALDEPIVVKVLDAFGNPVAGATVEFVPDPGDGAATPATAQTDSQGIAQTTWTVGEVAGIQNLRPVTDGAPAFAVVFEAFVHSDVADRIEVAGGDTQGGVAGAELPNPLEVEVLDQYGNAVRQQEVEFLLVGGDGSLSTALATTGPDGLASTRLTLGSAVEHRVEARIPGIAPATFVAQAFPPITLAAPSRDIATVQLSWSGATAAGFEAYEVRRAVGTPPGPTDQLVATITDPGTQAHADTDVELGTLYFYRVYTRYDGGFSLASNEQSIRAGVAIELAGIGWDMELSPDGSRVYVTIPSQNAVDVLSTSSFERIDSFFVGSSPRGLDISSDGDRLFAALNGAGAVAVAELPGGAVSEILIGNELGDDRTHDVLNPLPDVLVVSSSPSSSGFAYVVRVDLDFVSGHTASRMANNKIIRAQPTLGQSPGGEFVYVGEGFSPNSLYKLDMMAAGNPVVLEDGHGTVSGTTKYDVSPDGMRIYTSSGQVLRTGSFNQAGLVSSGTPLVAPDGTLCYVGRNGEIEVYNTSTFLQVGQVSIPGTVDRMVMLADGSALLALVDDLVYGVALPFE